MIADLIAGVVGGLVKGGFVAADQRKQAIDYAVAHMAESPEDIAGGYFADRETALGGVAVNLDELDDLPHDTEPPSPEDA